MAIFHLCFLTIELQELFIYLYSQSFVTYRYCNWFSPSLWFTFSIFLMVSFEKRFLILMRSRLSAFFFPCFCFLCLRNFAYPQSWLSTIPPQDIHCSAYIINITSFLFDLDHIVCTLWFWFYLLNIMSEVFSFFFFCSGSLLCFIAMW